MSWKRNNAQALAPPNATAKPAGGSRKQPSNLKRKPRFNSAVYAPGATAVDDITSTVWRTHDPSTDPFAAAAWDHRAVSSSSSPMRASTKGRKSTTSTRSIGTQTTLHSPAGNAIALPSTAAAVHAATDDTSDWRHALNDVDMMPAETVDYLLQILTDRLSMHERVVPAIENTSSMDIPSPPGHVEPPLPPLPPPSLKDASPSVAHVVNDDDDDMTEDDMTAITPRRSRSYEALVQLEAILETRHRQLMANGVLDDVRDNTSSPLVMTDIQSELYRIQHEPPLRQRPQRSQGDQTTPRRALDLIESDGWTFDPKHEFDDFPGTKTK